MGVREQRRVDLLDGWFLAMYTAQQIFFSSKVLATNSCDSTFGGGGILQHVFDRTYLIGLRFSLHPHHRYLHPCLPSCLLACLLTCHVSYGEGWDFGEVANNARGRNACQMNLFGSRIGR